jgi:hypothetical protein
LDIEEHRSIVSAHDGGAIAAIEQVEAHGQAGRAGKGFRA